MSITPTKRNILTSATMLITLLVLVQVVYADPIVVDSFDQLSPQVVSVACDPPTLPNSNTDFLANATILGGERDITSTITSCAAGSLTVLVGLGADVLAHGQLPAMTGSTEIVWDGTDGDAASNDFVGLGGIDLTDGGTNDLLHVRVLTADFDTQIVVTVHTDAANYSTLTQATTGGAGEYTLLFSDFVVTSGTGANFANVGAIILTIDGTAAPALDMTVDLVQATSRDFGDLPPAYGISNLADDGARHIVGSLFLGASVSGEADGQESATAVTDNAGDGIVPVTSNWSDGDGEVRVTVTGGAGCLWGWLDFTDGATAGADDSFDDTLGGISENIIAGVPVAAGTQNLTFPLPLGVADSQIFFARFRLIPDTGTTGNCSDDPIITTTGQANDGEVEDYQFTFDPTAVGLQQITSSQQPQQSALLIITGLLVSLLTLFIIFHRYQTKTNINRKS